MRFEPPWYIKYKRSLIGLIVCVGLFHLWRWKQDTPGLSPEELAKIQAEHQEELRAAERFKTLGQLPYSSPADKPTASLNDRPTGKGSRSISPASPAPRRPRLLYLPIADGPFLRIRVVDLLDNMAAIRLATLLNEICFVTPGTPSPAGCKSQLDINARVLADILKCPVPTSPGNSAVRLVSVPTATYLTCEPMATCRSGTGSLQFHLKSDPEAHDFTVGEVMDLAWNPETCSHPKGASTQVHALKSYFLSSGDQ